MSLGLDLNNLPPNENVCPIENGNQAPDLTLSLSLPTIVNQDDDDDVVICSPRSFAEAREKKSRRNPESLQLLGETITLSAARLPYCGNSMENWRQMTMSNNLCINLERTETILNLLEPIPQPAAPTFRCPVCIGPFVESTSTKCGHIFCKECISSAIEAQSKCPTCRRKLKAKDTFRVYLPASE